MQLICLIGSVVFFIAGLWLFFTEDMKHSDRFSAWRTTLFYLAMLGFIGAIYFIAIISFKGGF